MSDVFLLPDPGEGLTEADIVSWKVAAGDAVTVNQILVEIETAKSLVELPSPHAGTIGALLVDEGETVAVGTPIVRFGPVGGEDPAPAAPTSGAEASAAEAAPAEPSEESSGATLVGYGAVASSSRRRPRKAAAGGAAAPSAPAPSGSPATGGAAPAAPRPPSRRPMTSLPPRGVRHRPGATAGRWRSRPCGSSRRSTASTWRP